MPNPNPIQTAAFKAQQQPKYGDRPLSKRVVGTRYPEQVDEVLRSMSSEQCQRLIREAVEARLKADGLMQSEE
jgi:hypothetical protein